MQRREPGTRVQSIPTLDWRRSYRDAGVPGQAQTRSARPGSWLCLDEVYFSENLPPVTKADALASGERRMLQQMGIADLPERLQVVQTRTYQSRKTAPVPKTNPF